jgi:membrane associated rhomboid family serine protease
MARIPATRSAVKPEAFNDDTPRRSKSGARTWLSIPYLLLSVIVPSLFATQQMSFLRNVGPDLHWAGVVICALGAIVGVLAFLRMVRARRPDRNQKAAAAATLAGAVIFIVGAAVMASTTDNDNAARVGGLQDEAAQ